MPSKILNKFLDRFEQFYTSINKKSGIPLRSNKQLYMSINKKSWVALRGNKQVQDFIQAFEKVNVIIRILYQSQVRRIEGEEEVRILPPGLTGCPS